MHFDAYECSSAQKRLFMLRQLVGPTTVYNITTCLKIEGKIDHKRFAHAFQRLIARHESLRTAFEFCEEEVLQQVYTEVDFTIPYRKGAGENYAELVAEFCQPFDLSKPPLFRVEMVQMAEDLHLFLFDIDHIITDGFSNGIIIQDLIDLYSGKELAPLEYQYVDFVMWQNDLLESPAIQSQEEYWLTVLAGELPVLNLPADFPRPANKGHLGSNHRTGIGEELAVKVKELAQRNGATPFMVFLSTYSLLLAKYACQDEVIVGTPVLGRQYEALFKTVGLFVNTLALRSYPTAPKTFAEFLAEVKTTSFQAFKNQDYQFEMLVDKLRLQRDLSRNPLFDAMFVFQNVGNMAISVEGLTFSLCNFPLKTAVFDLLLEVHEGKDGFSLNWQFALELFKPETVLRMTRHFAHLLRQVVENPGQKLADYELITPEEKAEILQVFNDTVVDYPQNQTIDQLLQAAVERTPDNLAVIAGAERLTYRELHLRANGLAQFLREKGVGPEEIVGVMVRRGIDLAVALFGVLKAGGAYLPIDPDYPLERINFLLKDSRVQRVLAEPGLGPLENVEVLSLDDADEGAEYLPAIASSANLAYVIYTSGSTGQPKGVLIEHRSAVNTLNWRKRVYGIESGERYLQLFSFSFDAFVAAFFTPLLAGAGVVFVGKEEVKDPLALKKVIVQEQVTGLFAVPSMFAALLKCLTPGEAAKLKRVTLGGERIWPELIKECKALNPALELINEYGPTENSVTTTCRRNLSMAGDVTIGKPVDNTQVLILDKANRLLPVGVPGELCISGVGLARGYLHKEKLSAEKFGINPVNGERMYHTGDLAKWLANGELEFLGRTDGQVKIRGYRIELGEIEAEILHYPDIHEAAVVDFTAGEEKYLCAYIVEAPGVQLEIAALRSYLLSRLPEYMLPAYFILMEKLPLTPNGKIARQNLPEPNVLAGVKGEHVAPHGELEERLAQLMAEVLGVKAVSVLDNFFEIGGHSLKATLLAARIYQEFKVELPLREIFKNPRVREIAAYIRKVDEKAFRQIEPAAVQDYYPLSSAQKRIYLINQLSRENTSYNMFGAMVITGEIERERLVEAFQRLLKRHDSLRTSFSVVGGEPVQVVEQESELVVSFAEVAGPVRDDGLVQEVVFKFVRPFDLSQAPLLRVGLVKFSDAYFLMMDMHHIIGDGSSLAILMQEFSQLYAGRSLPELKLQYKDYVHWQREGLSSPELKKAENFWVETFAGQVPVLNLPLDFQRPVKREYAGDVYNFTVSPELTKGLKELGVKSGGTLFMVLLAAYNIFLAKYAGVQDVVVGTPTAGRKHPDLTQIIGMFVNTVALRNYPQGQKTFAEFLQEVCANTLQAFEAEDYQFELLVEKLEIQPQPGHSPLFDVMLVLQNIDNLAIDIAGLSFSPYHLPLRTVKYDLVLYVGESRAGLECSLAYSTELFKRATMEKLAGFFTNIMQSVVENPEIRIAEIKSMGAEQQRQLLTNFMDDLEDE